MQLDAAALPPGDGKALINDDLGLFVCHAQALACLRQIGARWVCVPA
jgi:hypothetical protein